MRCTPMKCYVCLILVLLLLFPAISQVQAAVRMDGLYTVELPVANQGRQERVRAMRQGMVEVITRISGSRSLEKFGQLLNVLDRSSRYILQYRYEQKPPDADAPPGTAPTLVIQLRYDSKSLLKLLQQQQLPIWGETRPETLVWLAVEKDGERFLQANDQSSRIYKQLQEEAQRRGAPILFPLLDLEDQAKVRTADVWGGFSDVIRKASVRYAVENMLAGRLFKNSRGEWEAHWSFINQTDEYHWSVKGKNLAQVLAAGMDGLGERLVARYAFRTDITSDTDYLLSVANVGDIAAYAKLERYLSSISLISRLELVSVEKTSVVYRIRLRGTLDNLKQFFGLGNTLVPDEVRANVAPVVGGAATNQGATGVAPGQSTTPGAGISQTGKIYYKLRS